MQGAPKLKSDIPLEDSIPEAGASLESILCTEELHGRPSRPPDYEKENRALVALMSALADSPSTIFQTLAETILDITQCDSAGLSLLTRDGKTPDVCGKRFYWPAIAGMWNPHVGGGTPRNFGPCGDVLDQNRTLLFRHFERRYPYLMPVIPAAEECLLVPFYVAGQAVGTIWAIIHSDRRKFDAEDDRVMASLGKFASSAYQALVQIEDLKFQVAEREKAEAAVRELANGLEAKFRCLVDANIMGIIIWNLEGEIVEANEAFLHIVGYNREDLASGCIRWTDLTPPEWGDRDERAVAELKALGIAKPYEKEYLQKGGNRVPVLVGGALFEQGANEGVAFVLDLSEQKRAEESLRRSEAYLTEAQRLSQTGSFGCRPFTGEMSWSEETFRIFGYDRTITPAVERILQRVHPIDRPVVEERINRAVRDGKNCDLEYRLLLPEDSIKYVHVVAHASKDESGNIEFIGAVMDVTATKQAEQDLQRSEAYLAEAQKLSHTGSFGWDVATGEIYWSRETFRIFEYEPAAKATIDMVLQRTHPEDRSAVQQLIDRVSRERKEWDFEHRLLMPDGSVKYLRVMGHPSKDERGSFEFVGAVTDITESKRAGDALRRSEQRWQTAFENSAIGMMMRDRADRFIAANRVFQNMLGYSESELHQLSNEDVTYDEDREANLELIRELLEGKLQHFQIEKRYRRKDGTLIWVRNNVALIPGLGEAAPFLFAVVEDISQRKQEESARRYSEERYRIVVETASDAVVSIDESSKILFVNPATSRIFGYDASELIGQPLTTLMPDYMRELHNAGFKRYLDTAQRHINWQGTELIALRKNSEEFPVEVSFAELAINGRRLFTGFIRDISERKQAEEIRKQAQKAIQTTQAELARVSRLTTMGELAASIAHEVNQPLTAVNNNSNACLRLLANQNLQPDVLRRALEEIVADGTRASVIIGRIRAFIKKAPAEKNRLDVNEVIGEVLVMMGHGFEENQILLQRELAEALPPVLGDRVQFQQVVLNLIMNGIEAMTAIIDRPRLLWVQSQIDESGDVLIAVRDSGTGLGSEVDRVFTPFFTTKASGMGMGLPISRSIIEGLGGRLWATPNSPHGAVFSFTLPIAAGTPS